MALNLSVPRIIAYVQFERAFFISKFVGDLHYQETHFLTRRTMQALDNLMPGFDKEIAKMAQRVLINPRKIDWYTGVLATKVTPGINLIIP